VGVSSLDFEFIDLPEQFVNVALVPAAGFQRLAFVRLRWLNSVRSGLPVFRFSQFGKEHFNIVPSAIKNSINKHRFVLMAVKDEVVSADKKPIVSIKWNL
jgi:hypothetical protein